LLSLSVEEGQILSFEIFESRSRSSLFFFLVYMHQVIMIYARAAKVSSACILIVKFQTLGFDCKKSGNNFFYFSSHFS
jgi:hypothetical protein